MIIGLRDLALEALRTSHQDLRRRAIEDAVGRDETQYLEPLFQLSPKPTSPRPKICSAPAPAAGTAA